MRGLPYLPVLQRTWIIILSPILTGGQAASRAAAPEIGEGLDLRIPFAHNCRDCPDICQVQLRGPL